MANSKRHKRRSKQKMIWESNPEVDMGATSFYGNVQRPFTIVFIDYHPVSGLPDGLVAQQDVVIRCEGEGHPCQHDEGDLEEYGFSYENKVWVRKNRHGWPKKKCPEIKFGHRLFGKPSL